MTDSETSDSGRDLEALRLRVEWSRRGDTWTDPQPYIFDGPHEFFLDPNQPRVLRLRPTQPALPWIEFDIDRLALIHEYLLRAREGGQ